MLYRQRPDIKLSGVCFGHQIVARALGATVARNERGWELSVTPHELSDEGKKIFGTDKLVCLPLPSPPLSPTFPKHTQIPLRPT